MAIQHNVAMPGPGEEPLTIPLPASDYSPDIVLNTIAVYAETGSIVQAANAYNISYATAAKWVKSNEATNLISHLRSAIRLNHAHTINKIIGLSLANTLERLEEGDMVMTKQGTMRAVPVSAKESAVIGSIMIDKYQLLTGSISEDNAADRLELIAERLEQAAKGLKGHNGIKDNRPEIIVDNAPIPSPGPLAAPKGEGEGKDNEGNNA